MRVPDNFEARRFEDEHQARPLAEWCGSATWSGTRITPAELAEGSPQHRAVHGDWLIKGADGAVRIERGGSQDGYCADCGEPLWWADGRLVTRSGSRWCQGKDGTHPGMTRWHALPGMAQYVVPAPEGQVCHCLDRDGAHIHQVIPAPDGQVPS